MLKRVSTELFPESGVRGKGWRRREERQQGSAQYLILKLHANRINIILRLLAELLLGGEK